MAAKMLSFDADARKSLLEGVTKLARAVKVTSSTAVKAPYFLVTASTAITGKVPAATGLARKWPYSCTSFGCCEKPENPRQLDPRTM